MLKITQKKVAILIYPNISTFEFGCAVELFSLPRPEYPFWYQTDVVSLEDTAFTATGGITIKSDIVLNHDDGFDEYDMVVIPAWTDINVEPSTELLNNLLHFHQQGGTLVSICSGSYVLAATGLLDGLEATTHWHYVDHFKEKFPNVCIKENVLFTDTNRIYTAAGSAAGIDLGMHIIKKDFGAKIANEVAKRLVISSQREGGQAQFAKKALPMHTDKLSETLDWAKQNLDKHITINKLAERTCYSRRTFDRHFRDAIGMSPKEWLIQQRLTLAREMLESSKTNVEQVAEASGFGSAMNLRHHFSQSLGVSPSHYRNQFIQS